jgi:hypothetical protein
MTLVNNEWNAASSFKAVAVYDENTKTLIVAYAGTDPLDKSAITADVAIVKNTIRSAANLTHWESDPVVDLSKPASFSRGQSFSPVVIWDTKIRQSIKFANDSKKKTTDILNK